MPLYRKAVAGNSTGGDPVTVTGFDWRHSAPSQTPDGIISTFTLPTTYVAGSVCGFLNGQYFGQTYITENGDTTVSLSWTPDQGDELEFMYKYAS